jgi:glycosyltransferase involved in cell wall biosynthesis
LRILILINGLDIGGAHGGAELFASELALGLAARGEFVCLAALTRSGTQREQVWAERIARSGVTLEFINPGMRRPLLLSFKKTLALCNRDHFDIANSHCQIGSVICVLLMGAGGIQKIVRSVHARLEWGAGAAALGLRLLLSSLVFPLTFDAQVAVSRSQAAQLEKRAVQRLVKKAIVLIPNALPEHWFRLPLQPRVYAEETGPVIGLVGALRPLKGQMVLLKAVQILAPAMPGLHVWVLGDGAERKKLEEFVRANKLEQHVEFLGAQADIEPYYRQMDLLVHPSLSEALPTVILEAMACGVPVIASRIEGVSELVDEGQTGWLFTPGDAAELAGIVAHVWRSPEMLSAVRVRGFAQAQQYRLVSAEEMYGELFRHYNP